MTTTAADVRYLQFIRLPLAGLAFPFERPQLP